MKTTSNRTGVSSETDLQAEYRFDYSLARPNRFASRMKHGTIAVVLDPDVASAFQSSEAVNNFLRSVLSAMPTKIKAGRA
jgi:hypothetical protein